AWCARPVPPDPSQGVPVVTVTRKVDHGRTSEVRPELLDRRVLGAHARPAPDAGGHARRPSAIGLGVADPAAPDAPRPSQCLAARPLPEPQAGTAPDPTDRRPAPPGRAVV